MKITRSIGTCIVLLTALALSVSGAFAAETALNAVLYPEGKEIKLKFQTTERAPKATLNGSVRPQQGQSKIEVSWKKLEPALLFGGDVNCWILWTVTPEGVAQSLGELPVRENRSGEATFSTSAKQFALMVTAEPLPAVRRPSDLVAFISMPSDDKMAKNSTFNFDGFRTIATKRDNESIAGLSGKYLRGIAIVAERLILLLDIREVLTFADHEEEKLAVLSPQNA